MKYSYTTLPICVVLTTLLIFGCKKEKDNVVATVNNEEPKQTYTSMSDMFKQAEVKHKTIPIDAGKTASFYGNSGTRYIVPANALETMDGTAVTGIVDVSVREFLKKGDMIFSRMLPVSDDKPLISGGEIDIEASQNGQVLKLKPGMTFTANIPQAHVADTAMKFFIGTAGDGNANQVNWQLPLQRKSKGIVVLAGDTLSMFSDTMTLCNADQFMTNPNYKNFTVKVNVTGATITNDEDVYSYAVYDNSLGMWSMNNYTKGAIKENHVPGIPVHFVVFTLIDGEFYGGMYGATPQDDETYTVTLNKADINTFKQKINGM